MDIGSKQGYPSSALSNFAPHPFEIDGVQCASMEGFLQSLKFKEVDMQNMICGCVGYEAKSRGRTKNWQETQTLWWRGRPMARKGDEYQHLLNRAYAALAENKKFRAALLATGDATLTHSIGRIKESETVLTRQEFCSRLTWLRRLS